MNGIRSGSRSKKSAIFVCQGLVLIAMQLHMYMRERERERERERDREIPNP